MTAPATLDLRGMRCPWPALRVGRALREGATELDVLADDPRAATEIAAVAGARGFALTIDAGFTMRIAPAAPPSGNEAFTGEPS